MSNRPDLGIERTLVLLKPDALARGLAGRVLTRLEDTALKVVGVKMRRLDAEFTRKHYFDLEEGLGAEGFNTKATVLQSGAGIAPVLDDLVVRATRRDPVLAGASEKLHPAAERS